MAGGPGSLDCIAIVGRSNNLQYFRSFCDADNAAPSVGSSAPKDTEVLGEEPPPALYLRMLLFSALDIVEERMEATSQTQLYLGMLCESDTRKVFCFVAMTGVRFFLVATDEHNVLQKSDLERSFLENLHQRYVDSLCNPFSQGARLGAGFSGEAQFIPSKGFLKDVDASVQKARGWWR